MPDTYDDSELDFNQFPLTGEPDTGVPFDDDTSANAADFARMQILRTPSTVNWLPGRFNPQSASGFDLKLPPSDSEVEQAFQVPAAVFDLELPWAVAQGRVLNKFGVRIGSFDNWEQADAVVAMMNASHQMLEAMAEIQKVSAPVPAEPVPAEPAPPAVDLEAATIGSMIAQMQSQLKQRVAQSPGMQISGLDLVMDPNLPAGSWVLKPKPQS